ncbi:MAG: BadF/BadG/BcrA/BcrD ATPase family protein [Bacteroidota bacterium]
MLVADSGSTKTEWRLCQGAKVQQWVRTQGFNPSTTLPQQLQNEFLQIAKAQKWQEVPKIWFYSTGTGTEGRKADLKSALQIAFPKADVQVMDDLTGAARSTLREEGVVAILGTGSNAAYHHDGKIVSRHGGLGYLLGDEGSGADLGKHLLKGVLEERLPKAVSDFLHKQEGMPATELMRVIYQAPKPHLRLSTLAPYYQDLLGIEEVRSLLIQRFVAFLKLSVLPLTDGRNLLIDTIGSIGFYYQGIFAEACEQLGLRPGKAILQPVDALSTYHLRMTED